MHITYFKYQITTQNAPKMLNTEAICSYICAYIATRVSSNISSKLNLRVTCSDRRWAKTLERLVIRAVLHFGRKGALQHQHKSPLSPACLCVVEGVPSPCGGNYWTVTATVSEGAGMGTWTVYSSDWHPCCIPSKCQTRRKAPGFSCSSHYSEHTSPALLVALEWK